MIEINLVPDVKQELIHAQRVRTSVISIAIIVGIAAAALVVLLAVYVFGIQTARGLWEDNQIKTNSEELSKVEDISNTLTVQNQLSVLPGQHDSKHIDSRVFDVLDTINPPEPNDIQVTNIALDSETNTISLEAQAQGGYSALEVFKKTINATQFEYVTDGERQSIPLTDSVSDSDRTLGQDANGATVLRFSLSFTYPDELFSRTARDARIVAPEKTNATDSFRGVPRSLFETEGN